MKNFKRNKFEFDWKGPYHVVDVGFPGTYWLMTPDGRRFDSTVNESDLAPWLQATESDRDFFYDGRRRSEEGNTVADLVQVQVSGTQSEKGNVARGAKTKRVTWRVPLTSI